MQVNRPLSPWRVSHNSQPYTHQASRPRAVAGWACSSGRGLTRRHGVKRRLLNRHERFAHATKIPILARSAKAIPARNRLGQPVCSRTHNVGESLQRVSSLDDAKFKQALANDHLSYSAFKQSIEEQLIIQKLVHTAVGHDIVVTDSEVARAKKQVAQASRRYKVMDYRLAVGDGADKQSLKAMQGLSKRLQEKGVVANQLLKASAAEAFNN